MTSLEAETNVISGRGRRLSESIHTKRLLRMLRSTLRRYPHAKLMHKRGGFGVSLGENRFLLVAQRGELTAQDTSDLLALFVVWLRADAARLYGSATQPYGSSVTGAPLHVPPTGHCQDDWHQMRLGDKTCECGDFAVDLDRSAAIAP